MAGWKERKFRLLRRIGRDVRSRGVDAARVMHKCPKPQALCHGLICGPYNSSVWGNDTLSQDVSNQVAHIMICPFLLVFMWHISTFQTVVLTIHLCIDRCQHQCSLVMAPMCDSTQKKRHP